MSDTGLEVNPRSFRVPGRDSQGHFQRLWLRMMPHHYDAIFHIVGGKRYPYTSANGLARHAIVRHLDWLGTLGPVPSTVQQAHAIMDLLRDEEEQMLFVDTIRRMHEVINKHLTARAPGEARRLLAQVYARIIAMPEGYWRERYLKELDEQYGHFEYYQSLRVVNLAGEGEDGK